LGNESIDGLLPKVVELSSWILEVERCSIFLFDKSKDLLYLKSTTGKIQSSVELKRKDMIL
jgi:hypothetical protein